MNGKKIVNAFKENLENRKILIGKSEVIGQQFREITQLISDVKGIYLVVFKSLSSKKEVVCKINDVLNKRTQYWNYNNEDDKIREVMLYLNNEGFSIGRDLQNTDSKSDTRHIHIYGDDKDFVRALKRLVEHKDEIWAKIKMPIKKDRFAKFTKAFEDNKLTTGFDDSEDYNFFPYTINKKIEFYEGDKIIEEDVNDIYIETNNPSCVRIKDKKRSYSNSGSIDLSEMEKIEQIYDEVVDFLDRITAKQTELLNNLKNFKEKLIEDFARELIIAKMDREAKEDKNR